MTAAASHAERAVPERFMEALSYRAPFLIEKLLNEQIVDRADRAEALFAEVIKYLILERTYPTKQWEMFSRRIDEVWHQFVLFTVEYVDFCKRYFGLYLHHAPGNSPSTPARSPGGSGDRTGIAPVADFAQHYQAMFGTPLPELWFDGAAMTLNQRLVVEARIGALAVTAAPGPGMVQLACDRGELLAVSELARPALDFMLENRAFYVRELPGDLTSEEKIGLAETLVARHVLLLAS